MADRQIVITPKDYKDLKENLSEKNVITSVGGNEYKISSQIENSQISVVANSLQNLTADTTLIADNDDIILNPNTLNKIFNDSTSYTNENAKFNPNLYSKSGKAVGNMLYVPVSLYGRTESLFLTGKFTFNTTDQLTELNPDKINCAFEINYTKSTFNTSLPSQSISQNNYNIDNYTQFFKNPKEFPINGGEDLTLEENNVLPVENSKLHISYNIASNVVQSVIQGSKNSANIEISNQTEYCKCTNIERVNGALRLTIEYNIRLWAGWCESNVDFLTQIHIKEIVESIKTITFKVYSTIVNTETQYFKYDNPNLINRKQGIYELEDSELMLFNDNQSESDKLSYKTAHKILEKYNKDRRIITFDLLNPKIYEIDERVVYDIPADDILYKQTRYIQENDIFTIYDEHYNNMGDFRVIKCNPIWDGAFHILITAIKIIEI